MAVSAGALSAHPRQRAHRKCRTGPVARSRALQRCEIERRAERARDAAQRLRVDTDGRGEHWHLAGERLEHRRARSPRARRARPPRRRRRSTAARAAGSTPPSVSSSAPTRPRELERAVMALLRPGGVGGKEQVGPVGIESERGSAPAARERSGGSARDRRRMAVPVPGARAARGVPRQRLGDGREEVDQRQHRAGGQPRARVAQVGPVDGQRAHARWNREGRPRGQPVVGVDDVEAPPAVRRLPSAGAVAAAQVDGRGQRARAGGTRTARLELLGGRAGAAGRRPGRGRTVPRSGWAASGRMLETTSARTILRP